MEKIESHRKGLLHRDFSVVILRKGWIFSKESQVKYHSGGLMDECVVQSPARESTGKWPLKEIENKRWALIKTWIAYNLFIVYLSTAKWTRMWLGIQRVSSMVNYNYKRTEVENGNLFPWQLRKM